MNFNSTLTAMMIFGALPCDAKTPNRLTVSALPTISSNFVGRYFSILKRGGVEPDIKTNHNFIIYHGRSLSLDVSARATVVEVPCDGALAAITMQYH